MNRLVHVTCLALLLAFTVGCDDSATTIPMSGSMMTAPSVTEQLARPLSSELIESLEYEVFTGILHPGEGGWLRTAMKTWPAGSDFSIQVPPNALPDDDNNPVEFSMRIPTYRSYMEHAADNLPLIVRLEPSNVNFLEPVTVATTYMPWVDIDAADIFEYFVVDPEFEEYGAPTVFTAREQVKIMFKVPHFSDWAVQGEETD